MSARHGMWTVCRILGIALIALCAGRAVSGPPAAAAEPERVTVRAGLHPEYARLVFDWADPVGHGASVDGRTLRVRFDRPLVPVFDKVRRTLRDALDDIRLDGDGRTVVAALKDDFTARSFYDGTHIVVDLTHATDKKAGDDKPARTKSAGTPVRLGPGRAAASAPPATAVAPPRPAENELLPIRVARHPDFGRLVFEWQRKVGFTVDRQGSAVTIRFGAPAEIDLPALRRQLPGQISAAIQEPSPNGLELRLLVQDNAQLRYFHSRNSVVFDVVARAPAGEAKAPPDRARRETRGREQLPEPATAARHRSLPPRLVTVDAKSRGASSEIRFNWRQPVSAAVYRREGRLWIVFDQPARLDLGPVRVVGGQNFAGVTQRQTGSSVQVRLPLANGFGSTVRRDGTVWVVTLGPESDKPMMSAGLEVVNDPRDGVTLQIRSGPGSRIVRVRDSDIGDSIVAVATPGTGTGLRPARRFPQFELLQSDQGVAIRALDDAVRVRSLGDRVVVTRPGGLDISPIDGNSLASRVAAGDRLLVDLAHWRFGPVTEFRRIENELLRAVMLPKGRQRNAARLGLARFYVGHGMGPEAIGVIETLLHDDPRMINDRQVRALRGVANYLIGHYAEASADLENLALAGVRELFPWRAGIAAARGDWKAANELFKDTDPLIAGMPPRFALKFGLLAAESALSVDDLDVAENRLAALSNLPATGAEQDQATYLRGHLLKKRHKISRAREVWKGIIENGGRQGKAKARLADINTELELKLITPSQAIKELEKLRFAWRNGVFEFDLLQTLGRQYANTGNLRRALVTLREAATYFKEIKGAQALTEDMRRLFRRYYLDGEADKLEPVVALGVYNEFRELTPSGHDGDRMIRKLAERLIAVDLLRQAAELLDHQVRFRLKGREKTETGTRLAQVLLMDKRPADALQALDATKGKDVPDEMVRDRRFMRAEAELKLKKPQQALATIASDHDPRFDLLRAQIYWQTGKWNAARLVLARLTGGFDPKRLDEAQAQLLLRRAVALRLSRNRAGIAFLRERFADGMGKTRQGTAFNAVVGRPTDPLEDFEALARQAAELDTFTAFMNSLYGKQRRERSAAAQSS